MIGGSADLTGSVFTNWSGSKVVARADAPGNYVNFGVREFAMSAIANGLALHGGFIPYVGTFLTFSDYARNALRMAALMKLRSIFVYTHDSIGLGEDGPDAPVGRACVEPAPHPRHGRVASVRHGRDRRSPGRRRSSAGMDRRACCSRARTCRFARAATPPVVEAIARGGYVLADFDAALAGHARGGARDRIGGRARDRRARCAREGRRRRARGLDAVHERVRPAGRGVSRLRAAARRAARRRRGRRHGLLAQYVGAADDRRGAVVGIDTFGESAPAPVLFKHFGFTVEHVVAAVKGTLRHEREGPLPSANCPEARSAEGSPVSAKGRSQRIAKRERG